MPPAASLARLPARDAAELRRIPLVLAETTARHYRTGARRARTASGPSTLRSSSTATELGLEFDGVGWAVLADGTEASFDMYDATVLWDGQPRNVYVYAAETTPLVGMRLLEGHDLHVEVPGRRPRCHRATLRVRGDLRKPYPSIARLTTLDCLVTPSARGASRPRPHSAPSPGTAAVGPPYAAFHPKSVSRTSRFEGRDQTGPRMPPPRPPAYSHSDASSSSSPGSHLS